MQTLDWLAHRAGISPRQTALIYGQQQWSYADLNRQVAFYAAQLAGAGVQPGHHVALLLPNRPEVIFLLHALARLGAVLVPLNIRLTEAELAWQLAQSDSLFLICSEETESNAASLRTHVERVLSVDASQTTGVQALANLPGAALDLAQGRPLDLEAPQAIVFTSGTTGRPKGAVLTFANHLWSATASAFHLGTDLADRWLLCMPLYHVGGMAIVFRCCLYGTTVVLQQGFEPEAVAAALETQAITLISLVPTMLRRLLATHARSLVNAPLRCILLGGAAAPPSLLDQALALNLPLAPTYGLTEAASQVATAPLRENPRDVGVGKPLMFTRVRILSESGQPCPPGEIGEIAVSGPTLMQGYYKQPEATRQTFRDGEFRTGDMGYLDAEGNLWVVQRRTDLIVSGGENVYPAEVEQLLREHPAVEEVCVVGLDDEEWGQRIAAAVVLKPEAQATEAELITWARQRLAGYKQPRLIRFTAVLPQTASGKIIREKVRDLLRQST